ncbi:glycoside hydrolase family 15 protein [Pseudolysinimonas sp.]|uniref:glycoside hydrolase family 15 protein n=1 Tax=Pseudolysinimonas sp. TaxID=2680009 RepID=UPI003F7D7150
MSRPLRDYAAIGDGRTIALVASDATIDWFPIPGLDTAPAFAALLDPAGGAIRLRPTATFSAQRRYEPGTNVLVTRFVTADGIAEVTDALVTGVAGRLPWTELARRVRGIAGSVELEWAVEPGNLFGDAPPERVPTPFGPLLRCDAVNIALVGSGHGRLDPHDPEHWVADAPPRFAGRFATGPGSAHLVCVVGTDGEPVHLPDPRIVDEGVDRTIANWQTWSREFSWDRGPWVEPVQRSMLALKLLLYSPTGAIAAAATTSLPESRAGGKNWDYRYAWIRDLAYAVDAMLDFGLREEPHAATSWMLDALKAHGDGVQVFLRLDGSRDGAVRRVKAEGWDGVGPVLQGNRAADQLQLGIFADVLGLLTRYVESGNMLDLESSDLLARLATWACERWPEKDSGLWELTRKRHYVSSKMACWQALDAACRLADAGHITPDPSLVRRWRRNRDAIRRWVDDKGWSKKRGAYVMWPGSRRLDASVLLHARSGFDTGERMSRTIDALRDELGSGPLLHRYSGMPSEEGAFVACSFWLAEALARVGRIEEARELMDELVRLPNDVGILAEMVDPADGSFLGNLPQALSHLALVQAARTITDLLEGRETAEPGRRPDKR